MRNRALLIALLVGGCVSSGTGAPTDLVGGSSDADADTDADGCLPSVVGSVHVYANEIAYSDGWLFVADEGGRVNLVDVSDPLLPVLAVSLEGPEVRDLVVDGNRLYRVCGDEIRIDDISDPLHPVELGRYQGQGCSELGSGRCSDVAVSGGWVYATDSDYFWNSAHARTIDARDASTPVFAGDIDTLNAHAMVADGDALYVASGGAGLRVLDRSNPAAPIEVGYVGIPTSAATVAVAGSFAYVGAYGGGLNVIDVGSKEEPTRVGSLSVHDSVESVHAFGGYVFTVSGADPDPADYYDDEEWTHSFDVVDVADPTNPRVIVSIPVSGRVEHVAFDGRYAYLGGDYDLEVVDLGCLVP